MYRVSAYGSHVEFVSRMGIRRTYTNEQWDMIWPRLLNKILG